MRLPRSFMIAVAGVTLVGAACGDDDDGDAPALGRLVTRFRARRRMDDPTTDTGSH